MATRIYNTDTRETVEIEVISGGQNILNDVIGGCGHEWASVDMPDDCDFAMSAEELEWWEDWSEHEQRILDKTEELGEDAEEAICGIADAFGYDMELLHQKEEEYLGIA